MFANHSAVAILSWINRAQAFQRKSDQIRHCALSAENLLIMGFVDDHFAQGLAYWDSPTNPTYSAMTRHLRELIFNANCFESFEGAAYKLIATGDEACKYLLIEGGPLLAQINYGRSSIACVEVNFAEGLTLKGHGRVLGEAVHSGLSYQLHKSYCLELVLTSLILMITNGYALRVDGKDQREVVIPEGAASVVEVGLCGSIRVLWADEVFSEYLRQAGHQKAFDGLTGLVPGRYACTAHHHWEEGEGGLPTLASKLTGYKLLMADQNRMLKKSDRDWMTSIPGSSPDQSSINAEKLVLVKLHSGDVLYPMPAHDIDWSVIGKGTVAQYKLHSGSTTVDLVLARRFYEVFHELKSQRPFLTLSITFKRSYDWVIKIEELSPADDRLIDICVQSTCQQTCHSLAMQQMLGHLR